MQSGGTTVGSGRLLKVEELADMLGVSPKTVYGWVYAKSIPHVKFGRSVLRFRPSDIDAWAESHTVAADSDEKKADAGSATK